jgi:hypothetical protein
MKLTPKQLDKNLGTTLWGGIVLLQLLLLMSYWGTVGMSLGMGEAILWLLGGLILLNESVVENGKELGKLKIFPLMSFLLGAAAIVFGIGLLATLPSLTALFLSWKAYLLIGVILDEVVEAFKKG